MADNLKKRGKADRRRVNVHQRHERRYWAKRFRCSQQALVLAAETYPNDPMAYQVQRRLEWAKSVAKGRA